MSKPCVKPEAPQSTPGVRGLLPLGLLAAVLAALCLPRAAWTQSVYSTKADYTYKEYDPAREAAGKGQWADAELRFGKALFDLGNKREGSPGKRGEIQYRYYAHLGRGHALVRLGGSAAAPPDHLRAFGLKSRDDLIAAGCSELARSFLEAPTYSALLLLYEAGLQSPALQKNALALHRGGEVIVSDWAWHNGDVLERAVEGTAADIPKSVSFGGLTVAVEHHPASREVRLRFPKGIPTGPRDLEDRAGDWRVLGRGEDGKPVDIAALRARLAAVGDEIKLVEWQFKPGDTAGTLSVQATLPGPPAGGWKLEFDYGFGRESLVTGKQSVPAGVLDIAERGIADGTGIAFYLEGLDGDGKAIAYTNASQTYQVSHTQLRLDPVKVGWVSPHQLKAESGEQRVTLELRSNQKLQIVWNARLSQSKQLVTLAPDPGNPYPIKTREHRWKYLATYVTSSADNRQVEVVPQARIADRVVPTDSTLITLKGQVVAWYAGSVGQVFTPGDQRLVFTGFQKLNAGDVEVDLTRPGYGTVKLTQAIAAANDNLEFPFRVGAQDLEGQGAVTYRTPGGEERRVPIEIRTRGARLEQIEPRVVPYRLQSLVRLRFAAPVLVPPEVKLNGPTGPVSGVIAGLDPAEPLLVKIRLPELLAGQYQLDVMPGGTDRDRLPLDLGLIAQGGRHSFSIEVRPNEKRQLRMQAPANRQPLGETLLLLELEEPEPNERPTADQIQVELSPSPLLSGKVIVSPGARPTQFLVSCPVEREMSGEVVATATYRAALGAPLKATASFPVESRRPAVSKITWNGRDESRIRVPGGDLPAPVSVQFECSKALQNAVVAAQAPDGTARLISARRVEGGEGRLWSLTLPIPRKVGAHRMEFRLTDEFGNTNEFHAELSVAVEKLNYTLLEPAGTARWTPGKQQVRVRAEGGRPAVEVLLRTAGKVRTAVPVQLEAAPDNVWVGAFDVPRDQADGQADILVEKQVAATVDLDVSPAVAALTFDPRVISRGGTVRISVQASKPLGTIRVKVGGATIALDTSAPRTLDAGDLLYVQSIQCNDGPEVRIEGEAVDQKGNRLELPGAGVLQVKEPKWRVELRSPDGRPFRTKGRSPLLGLGPVEVIATSQEAAGVEPPREVRVEVAWPVGGKADLIPLTLQAGGKWTGVLSVEPRCGTGPCTVSVIVGGTAAGSASFEVDASPPPVKPRPVRINKGEDVVALEVEEDPADPLGGPVTAALLSSTGQAVTKADLAPGTSGTWKGQLRGLARLPAGDYSIRFDGADRAGNVNQAFGILSVAAPAEPLVFKWVRPNPAIRLTQLPGEFIVSLSGADSSRMTVRLSARRQDDPATEMELGRDVPSVVARGATARAPRPEAARPLVSTERSIAVRTEARKSLKRGLYLISVQVMDPTGAPPAAGVVGIEQILELSYVPSLQRRAVLVALQRYQETWKTLHAPYDDARNLILALRDRGYSQEDIQVVTDAPESFRWPAGVQVQRRGTRNELEEGIGDAIKAARDAGAQKLLLFYAGHGISDENQTYLVPTDARLYPEELKRTTSNCLSVGSLLGFTRIPGSAGGGIPEVLLLLDACRASADGKVIPINTPPLPSFDGQRVATLYASEVGLSSYEVDGKGLFTTALVNVLRRSGGISDTLVFDVNAELAKLVENTGEAIRQKLDLRSQFTFVEGPAFLADFFRLPTVSVIRSNSLRFAGRFGFQTLVTSLAPSASCLP